jgi:hypothetical protein
MRLYTKWFSKRDSIFLTPSSNYSLKPVSVACSGRFLLTKYDVFNLILWSGKETYLTRITGLMLPLEYMNKPLP